MMILVILIVLLACARAASPAIAPWSVSQGDTQANSTPQTVANSSNPFQPVTRNPGDPIFTPTPDQPHALPTPRLEPDEYQVQAGDTLGIISQRYGIRLEDLIAANNLPNPDILEIGQLITIPAPPPVGMGPAFKIIPDSELVYGPASAYFNLVDFIQGKGGYLAQYSEDIDGRTHTGTQVVERIAYEYSVNPRLILALLEYQSGWVTRSNPDESTLEFPMGMVDSWRKGLYRQLAWTANNMNRGFYLWRVNGIGAWLLADSSAIPIDPTINAGTAGVQHLFSLLYNRPSWEAAVSSDGLFAIYNAFFGYPFDYAVEPLLPPGLSQPAMQLPMQPGKTWSYTGGPHGGWGDGSAWAAIDFAPPGEALGCVNSDEWVVAVSDGRIIRSSDGAVVQDLDYSGVTNDGLEQTGWTVLYMHVESRDRVQAGDYVRAGEPIGHPSCEGGVSTGTHLHLARRFNGEWIPADQNLPFVLDEWVSRGTGYEYDGYLQRDGQTIEAEEGRFPSNAIQR